MEKTRFQFGMRGVLLLVLLIACVFAFLRTIPPHLYLSYDAWHDVQGMTTTDVRKTLGEPKWVYPKGPRAETWVYPAGFGIIAVDFVDGKARGGWAD
jgi:hypothetical protein